MANHTESGQDSGTKRGPRVAGASEDSRERILSASLEEFANSGFEGATTAAVARRSGVTQPLVHYYFGTKDSLWRAAVDHLGRRLATVLAAAEEDTATLEPRQALRVCIRRFSFFCASNPELGQMIAREACEPSERFRWLLDKHVGAVTTYFETPLRRLGSLESADPLVLQQTVLAILGASSYVFLAREIPRGVYGTDPFEESYTESFAERLADIVLMGVGSES